MLLRTFEVQHPLVFFREHHLWCRNGGRCEHCRDFIIAFKTCWTASNHIYISIVLHHNNVARDFLGDIIYMFLVMMPVILCCFHLSEYFAHILAQKMNMCTCQKRPMLHRRIFQERVIVLGTLDHSLFVVQPENYLLWE